MSRVLNLRGVEFKISPLTFGQLRALKDDLATIGGIRAMPDDAQLEAVCRLVAAGLKKEHGYMELDAVAELIDLGNFQMVVGALIGVSGLEARPTMPVVEQPIGTGSTPT